MNKLLVAILASTVALFSLPVVPQGVVQPEKTDQIACESHGRSIDLNVPANLEAIERDCPEHFAKIQRILAEVPHRSSPDVPGWMRTEFDAKGVSYYDLLMTSDPPKKRLSFSLDGMHYTAVVTLTKTVKPLKAEKRKKGEEGSAPEIKDPSK